MGEGQTIQQSRRNTVHNNILREYNLFPMRLLSCSSCPLFVCGRVQKVTSREKLK
jgi:hypothetical protein